MNFRKYAFLVKSDLYRYTGKLNSFIILKNIFFETYGMPGFKFSFWMRTCYYLSRNPIFKYSLFPFAIMIFVHYSYKYGICIPIATKIGRGFYIGHFGEINVHPDVIIGKNCSISQGVAIGIAQRGERKGCPVIRDNVYIGPGAKIIGKVRVGNNVAIGANCVVVKDVPDNAVVVGIPGRIISFKGSEGYINNIYSEKKKKNI
jgi:serine O-acetyltransferase